MNQDPGLRGQAGMIGKLLAFWLIVLAIFAVAAIDATSIVVAHFHLSQVAANAAGDAESDFHDNHDAYRACQVARSAVATADPAARLAPHGCKVDQATGDVVLIVTKHASTLIAGRLSFTKKYATITESETAAPSAL